MGGAALPRASPRVAAPPMAVTGLGSRIGFVRPASSMGLQILAAVLGLGTIQGCQHAMGKGQTMAANPGKTQRVEWTHSTLDAAIRIRDAPPQKDGSSKDSSVLQEPGRANPYREPRPPPWTILSSFRAT